MLIGERKCGGTPQLRKLVYHTSGTYGHAVAGCGHRVRAIPVSMTDTLPGPPARAGEPPTRPLFEHPDPAIVCVHCDAPGEVIDLGAPDA